MIETQAARGQPLPDWYVNEPYVPPAEEFYLRAFYELITARNQDGRISWRDIDDYAERVGLEEDILPAFREIIRALERTFCKWLEDERAKKTKQATPEPTGPRQRPPKR